MHRSREPEVGGALTFYDSPVNRDRFVGVGTCLAVATLLAASMLLAGCSTPPETADDPPGTAVHDGAFPTDLVFDLTWLTGLRRSAAQATDLRRWRAKVPEQGTKSSRSCCEALLSRCKLAVHLSPFRPPGAVDRGPRRSIGGVSLLTTVDSSLPRWSRAVGCKRALRRLGGDHGVSPPAARSMRSR